jgi:hypothetical protein
MSDYFSELGKAMAAEISRNPGRLAQMRGVADRAITRHLGLMAMDSMPPGFRRTARDQTTEMPPRGAEREAQYSDQDPSSQISPDDCVTFLQMLLERMGPEDHDELVNKLADLIAGAHGNGMSGDQVPNNNTQVLDQNFRSGHRGARDNKRPGAMDANITALRSSNFQKRWGSTVGGVTVLGRS